MTPHDKRAFAGLLMGLGEAFNEPVSEIRAAIYFDALSDLSLDDVQDAVRSHVRRSTFFPKPAELRQIVLGTVEDRGELAWLELLNEVRRVGWTGKPVLDAPTARVANALFGNWRVLCENLPGGGPELLGYRKAFIAAFGAELRQEQFKALPPSHEEAKAALANMDTELAKRGLLGRDQNATETLPKRDRNATWKKAR